MKLLRVAREELLLQRFFEDFVNGIPPPCEDAANHALLRRRLVGENDAVSTHTEAVKFAEHVALQTKVDKFLRTKVDRQFEAGRWRRRRGFAEWEGGWRRMEMSPLVWRQWTRRGPGGALMRRRREPAGMRPSGWTLRGVRRLKTQGHHGHLGAGRRTVRFSFWARCQAASGVMAGSRWRSWESRWRQRSASRELGAASRQLAIAEGTKDFADVRGSEAVKELLIVFFIAGKMPERSAGRERAAERSVHL